MVRPYWELTVPATEEIVEGLTNVLWELGALGVVEEGELRAFFPPDARPEPLRRRVVQYLTDLTSLGYRVSGTPPAMAPVEDRNWAEAWREHFQPVPVGRRLLIAPPWNIPRTARHVIVIEPARAFGTGHHGSTAGCLALLERFCPDAADRPFPVRRMLDLGTGSGILAITAVKLGVDEAVAVDTDPDAIAAARFNATRNGVAGRVHCVLGDVADLRPGVTGGGTGRPRGPRARFRLVVANLLPADHHRLVGRYAAVLESRGVLVLGGIPEAEAHDIVALASAGGFSAVAREDVDGWTSLAFSRS